MEIVRKNRMFFLNTLSPNTNIVLKCLLKENIITMHDYNRLNQPNYTQEKIIINLLDNVMDKGNEMCHKFLNLLECEDLRELFRQNLKNFKSDETSQ